MNSSCYSLLFQIKQTSNIYGKAVFVKVKAPDVRITGWPGLFPLPLAEGFGTVKCGKVFPNRMHEDGQTNGI
jgi:hypothetical protein